MEPKSFIERLDEAINLKFTVTLIGAAILGITVWKGVHHFWPTAGALIGGAMLLVGSFFNKIYK